MSPNKVDFIKVNSTTAMLSLKSWQPRGCSIHAFTIQYKPIHQKQWIPLVEYFDGSDYFYVSHLSSNRDYMVLVSAHSDAGITRQEYTFHTSNNSAVVRMGASASPQDHYNRIESNGSPSASSLFRNLTVMLPVMISLLVLIVILGTLFGCMRRQHVNHVVNGINANNHSDLCHEHLNSCLHNSKEAMMMDNGRRRSECYPLSEFRGPANATSNNCSLNNSCDSKSNLLNGNLNSVDVSHRGQMTNTSPRHHPVLHANYLANQEMLQASHFSTLNCKMKLLTENASYYSSPQRKLGAAAQPLSNQANQAVRCDHEYAEPVQAILNRNRCSVDLLLNDEATLTAANSESTNHCQFLSSDTSSNLFELTIDSGPKAAAAQSQATEAYATINKRCQQNMPYL